MIAAPCLGIVLDHTGGDLSDSRLPGYTVTFFVPDDQVRSRVQVRPAVQLVSCVHAADRRIAEFVVLQAGKAFDQFSLQLRRFGARRNDPAGLAALQVQVKSAQTQAVGAGAAPVHAAKVTATLGGAVFEDEITVLAQP